MRERAFRRTPAQLTPGFQGLERGGVPDDWVQYFETLAGGEARHAGGATSVQAADAWHPQLAMVSRRTKRTSLYVWKLSDVGRTAGSQKMTEFIELSLLIQKSFVGGTKSVECHFSIP